MDGNDINLREKTRIPTRLLTDKGLNANETVPSFEMEDSRISQEIQIEKSQTVPLDDSSGPFVVGVAVQCDNQTWENKNKLGAMQETDCVSLGCTSLETEENHETIPKCGYQTNPEQPANIANTENVTPHVQSTNITDSRGIVSQTVPTQPVNFADTESFTIPIQSTDITCADASGIVDQAVPEQPANIANTECVTTPIQSSNITDTSGMANQTVPEQSANFANSESMRTPVQSADITDTSGMVSQKARGQSANIANTETLPTPIQSSNITDTSGMDYQTVHTCIQPVNSTNIEKVTTPEQSSNITDTGGMANQTVPEQPANIANTEGVTTPIQSTGITDTSGMANQTVPEQSANFANSESMTTPVQSAGITDTSGMANQAVPEQSANIANTEGMTTPIQSTGITDTSGMANQTVPEQSANFANSESMTTPVQSAGITDTSGIANQAVPEQSANIANTESMTTPVQSSNITDTFGMDYQTVHTCIQPVNSTNIEKVTTPEQSTGIIDTSGMGNQTVPEQSDNFANTEGVTTPIQSTDIIDTSGMVSQKAPEQSANIANTESLPTPEQSADITDTSGMVSQKAPKQSANIANTETLPTPIQSSNISDTFGMVYQTVHTGLQPVNSTNIEKVTTPPIQPTDITDTTGPTSVVIQTVSGQPAVSTKTESVTVKLSGERKGSLQNRGTMIMLDGKKKYGKMQYKVENSDMDPPNKDNLDTLMDLDQQSSTKSTSKENHSMLLGGDQHGTKKTNEDQYHDYHVKNSKCRNHKQVPRRNKINLWNCGKWLYILFLVMCYVNFSSGQSSVKYGGNVVLSNSIVDGGAYTFSDRTEDFLHSIKVDCSTIGYSCSPRSKERNGTVYTPMINTTHVSLSITNITANTPTKWNFKKGGKLIRVFELFVEGNVMIDVTDANNKSDSTTNTTNGPSLGVEWIIGIAVGGPVVVGVAVFIYWKWKRNHSSSLDISNYSSVPLGSGGEGMNYEMDNVGDTTQRRNPASIQNGMV